MVSKMTFEEWYETTYGVSGEDCIDNTEAFYQYQVARLAWEASRKNLNALTIAELSDEEESEWEEWMRNQPPAEPLVGGCGTTGYRTSRGFGFGLDD